MSYWSENRIWIIAVSVALVVGIIVTLVLTGVFDSDETATPAKRVPGKPTNVSATSSAPNTVVVQFAAPADDGGSDIINYTAEIKTENVSVTSTTSPIRLTTTTGTKSVTVYATNAIGKGADATVTATVGDPVDPQPTARELQPS
jgi:amino acid transporter